MLDLNNVTPPYRQVNFRRINDQALAVLPALLMRWLPGGKVEGCEYVVRNPRRAEDLAETVRRMKPTYRR